MKRSALALLAVTLSVVSLHAQMGSATGPANMMSTEVSLRQRVAGRWKCGGPPPLFCVESTAMALARNKALARATARTSRHESHS
jgi:hypothetical protein